MKNCNKLFGIITLLIIGFIICSCQNGTTDEIQKVIENGTYYYPAGPSSSPYRIIINGSGITVEYTSDNGSTWTFPFNPNKGKISFNKAEDKITIYFSSTRKGTGDFTKVSNTEFRVTGSGTTLDNANPWTKY